jgi:hypothetical protein
VLLLYATLVRKVYGFFFKVGGGFNNAIRQGAMGMSDRYKSGVDPRPLGPCPWIVDQRGEFDR